MSPLKAFFITLGLFVVAAEVIIVFNLASGPPPFAPKNVNASVKTDPKNIDWIAVQNKVLGYKPQKITPWEPTETAPRVTHVDIDPSEITQESTNDDAATQGALQKTAKTTANNQCADDECKYAPLWDSATPAKPTTVP